MNFDEVDKAMRAARVETFAKMRDIASVSGQPMAGPPNCYPPDHQGYGMNARLEADHAHLKAWNEELVRVLAFQGCKVGWLRKHEIEHTVFGWMEEVRSGRRASEPQYPRCLAAMESKLAEHERVWQEQADEINRLNAELETCRRRHQA